MVFFACLDLLFERGTGTYFMPVSYMVFRIYLIHHDFFATVRSALTHDI